MAKIYALLGVVTFVVWVYTLAKVVMTPEAMIRSLPKVAWILIVLFFPMLGTIGWYVLGAPQGRGQRPLSAHERARPDFPEYDRPGRAAAADPEKDAEFLRKVRERAEQQRKQYDAERRKAQPEPPTDA